MQSADPTFPLYPIMAFLGFVLALIPLPLHLQAWNSGTCAYMFWASLSCLIKFINSIVWAGNLDNKAPVWCDISTKFIVGAGAGITASILCTSRRLYILASVGSSRPHPEKKRMIIVDLCIAFGIPILVMVLHYIVQPHRYDIYEDIGCLAVFSNTLLTYLLVHSWPLLLGCISFVYSALALRLFWMRRTQFAKLLISNPSLSVNRYVRLMLFCLSDMILTVPLAALSTFFGRMAKPEPYVSWKDVHTNFSHVDFYSAIVWRNNRWMVANLESMRWTFVISALIFFVLFGLGSDVRKYYADIFRKALKQLSIFQGIWRKHPVLPSWRKDPKLTSVSKQQSESTLVIGASEFEGKRDSTDKEAPIADGPTALDQC